MCVCVGGVARGGFISFRLARSWGGSALLQGRQGTKGTRGASPHKDNELSNDAL